MAKRDTTSRLAESTTWALQARQLTPKPKVTTHTLAGINLSPIWIHTHNLASQELSSVLAQLEAEFCKVPAKSYDDAVGQAPASAKLPVPPLDLWPATSHALNTMRKQMLLGEPAGESKDGSVGSRKKPDIENVRLNIPSIGSGAGSGSTIYNTVLLGPIETNRTANFDAAESQQPASTKRPPMLAPLEPIDWLTGSTKDFANPQSLSRSHLEPIDFATPQSLSRWRVQNGKRLRRTRIQHVEEVSPHYLACEIFSSDFVAARRMISRELSK